MRYVPGVDQPLFLSGDLGYWNQDGMIEIIGRNDSQIKIHGYRIEIEEIEQLLLTVEEIQKSSVVCVEQKLVAFVKAARTVSHRELYGVFDEKTAILYDAMAYHSN